MTELVEAKTPTFRQPPQSPKLGGCVGIFFNFFDWNKRLQGSRLFTKRLPAERPSNGDKFGRDGKLIAAKLLRIADESRSSSPGKRSESPERERACEKGEVAKDGTPSPPKRVPGVVARLMGLESLPSITTRRSLDGQGAESRREDVDACSSVKQPRLSHSQQQPALPDQSEDGRGNGKRSAGKGKGLEAVGSSRRPAVDPKMQSHSGGKRVSIVNEAMKKSPSKEANRRRPEVKYGERKLPPVSVSPDLACHIRPTGRPAKAVSDGPKQALSKLAVSRRRPVLLGSKNHSTPSSPVRSPTKIGSKSAAILLEAAQKILEPGFVKGRGPAGRASPIKLGLQDADSRNGGGRRALDYRGSCAGVVHKELQGRSPPRSFNGSQRSTGDAPYTHNGASCLEPPLPEADEGSDGRRRRSGSRSPGRSFHSLVTLRPYSASKSTTEHQAVDEVKALVEGHVQPSAEKQRRRFLWASPTREGDSVDAAAGSSQRIKERETDFESVLSRYQDLPKQETGRKKKKESFRKHNQLANLSAEQKSELVRSLTVADKPETLHRSGSVKEKVSLANVGSLLRSKSAREDKRLVRQANLAETETAQVKQGKGDGEAQVKGSGQGSSGAPKSFPGGLVDTSSSNKGHRAREAKGNGGFRAIRVLRSKSARKPQEEADVSPVSSKVFPAAAASQNERSPVSEQGSESGESGGVVTSGGGLLSYSRLFGSRRDGQAENQREAADGLSPAEEQSPKKKESWSLLRRKPTSPEPPVVLKRGSKKIQAERVSSSAGGLALSMSLDFDEGFGSRGSSFDLSSGKLPLGCLISELADVLENKESASQGLPEEKMSPRKPSAIGQTACLEQKSDEARCETVNAGSKEDLVQDWASVDQDYQRRKARAKLTRALQRGAITQLRGDVLQHDLVVEESLTTCADSPVPRHASALPGEQPNSDLEDEGGRKSFSPLTKFLMERVKEIQNTSDQLEIGSKRMIAMSLSKTGQILDSLEFPSAGFDVTKYEASSPYVKSRVLIAEADAGEAARESSCSDDSGQPSPVSILEAPFQDEGSQDTTSQEGSSPKAQVLIAEAELEEEKSVLLQEVGQSGDSEVSEEEVVVLESMEDTTSTILEAVTRIRQSEPSFREDPSVSATEDEDVAYITAILKKANLLGPEPGCSPAGLPLDAELFNMLEDQDRGSCGPSWVKDSFTSSSGSEDKFLQAQCRMDRKLFFDCVNEALCLRLLHYLEQEPWVQKAVCLRPRPCGKELVKQVYDQVSAWRNMDVESLDKIILQDMMQPGWQWANFDQEVTELGLEIERHIFKTVLEEFVNDTAAASVN